MTIQPSQNITQSLIQQKKINSLKKETQKRKNKLQEIQVQNSINSYRCDKQDSLLLNQTNLFVKIHKIDRSFSRETYQTSQRKSLDCKDAYLQKSIQKINLQQQADLDEMVKLKNENERNPDTSTFLSLKKKKKLKNANLQQNQYQNQDNFSSHHQVAIQGNEHFSLQYDTLNNICGVNYVANTLDQNKQTYKYKSKPLTEAQKLLKIFQETESKIKIKKLQLNQQKIKEISNCKYSLKNQILLPQFKNKPHLSQQELIKFLKELRIVSLNFDTYLQGKDRKSKQKYCNTLQLSRIKQFMKRIKMIMEYGIDFICLQQVSSKTLRIKLLQILKEFNSSGKGIYYYPQNLQKKDELLTTMILTKHNVRFGQFQFKIKDLEDKYRNFINFPKQAFCQIDAVINQKEQNLCIFSCHLKSNRGYQSYNESIVTKKKQIGEIHHFSKKYSRFFCIGDTNIGQSKEFESENIFANGQFYDAVNYELSQKRGTYLYENKDGQIVDERLDRVWIDHRSASKTLIKIEYVDLLLRSCKNLKLQRKQMLLKKRNDYQHVTITDHAILDITIKFIQ